jgi:hypothetical protein
LLGGFFLTLTRVLHQALGCRVMVILQTIFMPHHLTIQLIDQFIHCGIQISVRAFGKNIRSLDMNVALRSLSPFFFFLIFDREQNFDIDNLIKVPHNSIKLSCDITAQSRCNFKVMTADRQVHKYAPVAFGLKKSSSSSLCSRKAECAMYFNDAMQQKTIFYSLRHPSRAHFKKVIALRAGLAMR